MLQTKKPRFATTNIALIATFSALWVALNLTVAPLAFTLTHLPTIHSAIIFVMLLLVTWATGQYGAASLMGVIGSVIVVFAGGPLPVLGFVPSALIFDLFLYISHHNVNVKPVNVGTALLASIICAYVAAVVNGFLILSLPSPMFTLTVWGGWNILGAIIGFSIAFPIIVALEKAEVRKVKAE